MTRAAGIGASPESTEPFDNSVCCGRSGSNGPKVGSVKFCHTRENGPNGPGIPAVAEPGATTAKADTVSPDR